LENVQLGVREARSCVKMRERGGEGAGRGNRMNGIKHKRQKKIENGGRVWKCVLVCGDGDVHARAVSFQLL
jgi:hypothetical protein